MQDARHIRVPTIGIVRLHSNLRRHLKRARRIPLTIVSVTIRRRGDRWWASLLVREPAAPPREPSRRQRAAGAVGVDLGIKSSAVLSTRQAILTPRWSDRDARRVALAKRDLSRKQKGSRRHGKAKRRVGRLAARTAASREGYLHQATAWLTRSFEAIAIEDLKVANMSASAKGTEEAPGRNVRAKAGLDREILDVGFGEFRRQLTYKAVRSGCRLVVVDQYFPSSKRCSRCGHLKKDLTLKDRTYRCGVCDFSVDRDVNAALNLVAQITESHPDGTGELAIVPATENQGASGGQYVPSMPDCLRHEGSRGAIRDARGRAGRTRKELRKARLKREDRPPSGRPPSRSNTGAPSADA